jgi:branched-chain amino acid transport system permease protein
MVALTDVTPMLAPSFTLLAFTIVIVGGLGSMAGALLGGLLIGVVEALASVIIAPSMKSMVSFALLVAVLALRPQGLLGKPTT